MSASPGWAVMWKGPDGRQEVAHWRFPLSRGQATDLADEMNSAPFPVWAKAGTHLPRFWNGIAYEPEGYPSLSTQGAVERKP